MKNKITPYLLATLLLSGCSSSAPVSSESVASDQSEQSVESDSAKLSYVSSIPFSSTVQQFPIILKDYQILKDNIRGKMRLFGGGNEATVFPELRKYSGFSAGANACSAYYWMIRWRSQSSNVELGAGTSVIPSEPGVAIKWESGQPLIGGAGYMKGFSCVTPYIFFHQAINESKGNLVDVNYEVLIWEHYPDI